MNTRTVSDSMLLNEARSGNRRAGRRGLKDVKFVALCAARHRIKGRRSRHIGRGRVCSPFPRRPGRRSGMLLPYPNDARSLSTVRAEASIPRSRKITHNERDDWRPFSSIIVRMASRLSFLIFSRLPPGDSLRSALIASATSGAKMVDNPNS